LRPVGPEPRVNLPRLSNVGDGPKPSADIRILKGQGAVSGITEAPAHGKPGSVPVSSRLPAAAFSATGAAPLLPASHAALKAGVLPGAAAELSSALRLPADSATFAALSALLGENLPLDTKTAQAIRRIARLHNDDPAAARIAARALAAGLDPEGAAVQKVLGVLDPADSSGSGGSFSDESAFGGGSAGHGDSRDRHPDSRPAYPVPVAAADGEEIRNLAASLKTAALVAMKDPDLRDLAARNADGSGWVCVPFIIPFAGINFHGFFRILYYATMGHAGKLVADIRFGEERRLLELTGSGPDAVMAYHADDEHERQAFDAEFSGVYGNSASALAAGDFSELLSRRSINEDA